MTWFSINITNTIKIMDVYQIPENNGNIPFSIPIGGNGMFGNGNGFNSIADLFGLAIIASMFGWGNGGFGGGFGGGGNGAAFLSNQITNDAGRELIMQAVTSQGEASRTAIQTLSTMLGQDFNLVNNAVGNVQNSLNQIANAQGMNALQVINAIQSGDASIISAFQNCCCQNQLALSQGFSGVQQSLAAKAAADQLSVCQQTNTLVDAMNRNYVALDNKIDALESDRKNREITALTAKVAQLESQNFTTGVIAQAMAPVNAQLASIRADVDSVKCKLPETVTLPNSQYAVVPTWAANIGSDFVASYWANRLSAATTPATEPTTGAV